MTAAPKICTSKVEAVLTRAVAKLTAHRAAWIKGKTRAKDRHGRPQYDISGALKAASREGSRPHYGACNFLSASIAAETPGSAPPLFPQFNDREDIRKKDVLRHFRRAISAARKAPGTIQMNRGDWNLLTQFFPGS
jgi:hypothetical protein